MSIYYSLAGIDVTSTWRDKGIQLNNISATSGAFYYKSSCHIFCLQLTDPEVMKEACEDKQLCVLAFLPHILDCQSECRNEYLTVLTKMADHYKQRMWG